MLDDYRHILSQNAWKTDRTLLPEQIADWLFVENSLTTKLEQHCQHFSVTLVRELSTEQDEWLREVILSGDGKNWVFAQTYFSKALMEKCGTEILQLNQTPLGYWLFAKNPKRINAEWLQDEQTGLYARRSTLEIEGATLQVSELFLAEFDFPSVKIAEQ